MPEVATLPSATRIVADYLRADSGLAALVGTRVYTRTPSNPIYPLIRIQRVAGTAESQEGWLDYPRIQVEAWADSEWGAEQVALAARRALFALKNYQHSTGVAVMDSEALGLQFLPDPATDRPRWLFDVNILVHPIPA